MIIFNYYHLNWNNLLQLIKENKSIKLNYTADQLINLNSFVDKWKYVLKETKRNSAIKSIGLYIYIDIEEKEIVMEI